MGRRPRASGELSHAFDEAKAGGLDNLRDASANRRPKTLLSGLLIRGACGGTVAKRGNNRFGCVSHIMGKGCSNGRTIVRAVLEERVLAGLRFMLMAPEAMA